MNTLPNALPNTKGKRIQMVTYISASPAYGRDYRSAKTVLADWHDGKDFKDNSSLQYFNKDSFVNEELEITIQIRYSQLQKLTMVKPQTKVQNGSK